MKRTSLRPVARTGRGVGAGHAQAPRAGRQTAISQVCLNCHKAEPATCAARSRTSRSSRSRSSSRSTPIRRSSAFDEAAIKVVDVARVGKGDMLRDIAKGPRRASSSSRRTASRPRPLISFKGPIKIAPDKVVKYGDVLALVAQGPDKADAVLIDSRPLPRFQEGTIPGAINLPIRHSTSSSTGCRKTRPSESSSSARA